MADKEKTQQAIKKIESFCTNDMSPEQLMQAYEKWDGYDQDLHAVKVHASCSTPGPSVAAKEISEYYLQERDEVAILDIAAGTGLVGEELHKLGFRKIDALDPSQPMLDRAKQKKVYRNFVCAFINETMLDIPGGSYDAVTCSGAIAEGHIPAGSVKEMFRLVKPGGVIVIAGNAGVWKTHPEYSEKMANIIKGLEKEGKLQTLKEEIINNYRTSEIPDRNKGIVIVMKKCKENQ